MSGMAEQGDLDPALLDPTRLSIVSLLAATNWAEFGYVRDSVRVSDSALSKQVSALDKLGYVEVDKGYVGKRPRTWLNLSDAGREALEGSREPQRPAAERRRGGVKVKGHPSSLRPLRVSEEHERRGRDRAPEALRGLLDL